MPSAAPHVASPQSPSPSWLPSFGNPTIALQMKYSLTKDEKIYKSFHIHSARQNAPKGILITKFSKNNSALLAPVPEQTTALRNWREERQAQPGLGLRFSVSFREYRPYRSKWYWELRFRSPAVKVFSIMSEKDRDFSLVSQWLHIYIHIYVHIYKVSSTFWIKSLYGCLSSLIH